MKNFLTNKYSFNELFSSSKMILGGKVDNLKDEGLKELLAFFVNQLQESPIAFKLDDSAFGNGFSISGPLGLKMWVRIHEEDDKSSSYSPSYRKVGYIISIEKNEIKVRTELGGTEKVKDLINKLKKSIEYKHFIKGYKVEKLQKDRIKKILSQSYSDKGLIDFIYYSYPTSKKLGGNDSNPWATTGSSTTEYLFDIQPAMNAWGTDKVYSEITSLRDEIVKVRGYRGGGISSNTDEEYEIIDGDKLRIVVDNLTYYN